jgi:hypothetical protein
MGAMSKTDDLVVTFPKEVVDQLVEMAPQVGVDPQKPVEVIGKALRLLKFTLKGNGNVTVSSSDLDFKTDVKKL